MIVGVQLLRFLAASFVVMAHCLGEYEWATGLRSLGSFGVDIFFVISGFIIFVITEKEQKYFFLKRIIRIVPLYWIFTFAISFLALFQPGILRSTSFSIEQLIASLMFVPLWNGESGFFPILKLGWTLNLELFFYFIFYLAMRISHAHRIALTSVLIVLIVSVLNYSNLGSPESPHNFYATTLSIEFIFGMVIGYLYKNKFLRDFSVVISCLLLIGPAVLMLFIQIFGLNYFGRVVEFGLPSAFLLIGVLGSEHYILRSHASAKRVYLWLGDISYPLYLVHLYCIALLSRVLFKEIEFIFLFPLALTMSVIVSQALNVLFDFPLRKWIYSKVRML